MGILAVIRMASPAAAAACFTIAAFGADMTISPSWVYFADIAGPNTGGVSGSMNMLGNLGSFVSANDFPYLYGLTGSASAYFFAATALNTAGLLCWFRMRSLEGK
jgi:ACS family glucarate transporter-like MFS transporter